jgi:uncharacterized protein (DUF924 family)
MTGQENSSAIADFWFSEAAKPNWFKRSDAFDRTLKEKFEPHYIAARNSGVRQAGRPDHAMELVLLFDQSPRNAYRGTPQAFATDAQALAIAKDAIANGFDATLDVNAQLFLYLPFEHAEDMEAQEKGVLLIEALGNEEFTRYARLHRDIIRRFGRFPHRNDILGRVTTPEEAGFLKQPGSSF